MTGTRRDSEDGRRRFVACLAGPVPLRRRPGPEHQDIGQTTGGGPSTMLSEDQTVARPDVQKCLQ